MSPGNCSSSARILFTCRSVSSSAPPCPPYSRASVSVLDDCVYTFYYLPCQAPRIIRGVGITRERKDRLVLRLGLAEVAALSKKRSAPEQPRRWIRRIEAGDV